MVPPPPPPPLRLLLAIIVRRQCDAGRKTSSKRQSATFQDAPEMRGKGKDKAAISPSSDHDHQSPSTAGETSRESKVLFFFGIDVASNI